MMQSLEFDAAKPSRHWTDEQFSDYMLGLGMDREARIHLEGCAVCLAEVEKFEQSVSSFSRVSLAWGEERSAQQAVRRVQPARTWVPTAAWALAAGLAVAFGIPAAYQHRASENAQQAAQTALIFTAEVADAENSDAAIARDNQLMSAVAFELDHRDPLPAGLAPDGAPSQPVPSRNE